MTIRVLVVCDGDRFSFSTAPQAHEQFTIAYFLNAIRSNPGLDVKTAHRSPADPLGAAIDIANFRFDTTDLAQFDVLWLIGDEGVGSTSSGTAIDNDQLAPLADFMDGGGGVFATGDHEGIGAQMCGRIPRVRTMRWWYWDVADIPSDVPAGGAANWPVTGPDRADTTQMSPGGGYYFDSQSDRVPQPLMVLEPTHPILQVPSGVLNRFPDHMHEGQAIVPWTTAGTFNFGWAMDRPEYPPLPSVPFESPKVLATGTVIPGHSTMNSPSFTGPSGGYPSFPGDSTNTAAHIPIGVLGAYDGRKAGVGRVVIDGSFHHLLDINLVGDIEGGKLGGATTAETHAGFNNAPDVLADMTAFFNNTVAWLARPARVLAFAIDKSTYGKDEAQAHAMHAFDQAIYVIVDGLKPSDFPGGPIDEIIDPMTVTPSQLMKLATWAPAIPTPPGTGITFTPIGVASDDPGLPARVQRFTFAYRVTFTDMTVFDGFTGAEVLNITCSLGVTPAPAPDSGQIELITDADPYFSNYGDGNSVGYLSADLRVFRAIEGDVRYGMTLGHTEDDARAWLQHIMANITSADFTAMDFTEGGSALSITTETLSHQSIFNFALARVRLNGMSLPANSTRVFFRVFQAPTTASLTYTLDGMGQPQHGYRQFVSGSRKVPLVGISADGTEYLSFPCFAERRATNADAAHNMTTQTDGHNVQNIPPGMGEVYHFFGAFLDTNRPNNYFPSSPSGQAQPDGPFSGALHSILDTLNAGVHQCLGAEIVFDGAPIPTNATPGNSDKLAQRNIAYTTVANPGTPSSRTAVHSFEVRPSPVGLGGHNTPDELMIDWRNVPRGSQAAFYLPAVSAEAVVALADKMYATHRIVALDAHTLSVPVGGISYIPLPTAGLANFAGLFTLDIPAGIVKGQRFDVSVRQLTTKGIQTLAGAKTAQAHSGLDEKARRAPKGRSEKDRKARLAIHEARVAESRAFTRLDWRVVYGGFQIAIPVSTKADMLLEEAQTLSIMLHRAALLSPNSRWYPVFQRYVDVLVARFEGLGGDPETVRPSPDGLWPGIEGIAGAGKGRGHGLAPLDRLITIGKVDALVFDHFGDFEAFVIETEAGRVVRFDSREPRILALVRRAWEERVTVGVHAAHAAPHRPLEVVLLRAVV